MHTPDSARERIGHEIGADPYQGIEKLREIGRRKAQAEGRAYQLEHERHVVLARIMNELAVAHASEKLSEAKLDRMARADQRYREHIAKTAAAIEIREEAHSEYWAVKSELEWDTEAIRHANHLTRL